MVNYPKPMPLKLGLCRTNYLSVNWAKKSTCNNQ